MTRDEIIEMAREVDLIDFRDAADDPHTAQMVEFLERFAALVAAAEREACALVCDDFERAKWESILYLGENARRLAFAFAGPMQCAAAIRAREAHPEAAQRKPMTEDEMGRLMKEFFYTGMEPTASNYANFARAIEAAHGIKEQA